MQILALLDKPSPKSFGMVPIAVRSGSHDHYVLSGQPLPRPITPDALHDLCISGHAYDVGALRAQAEDPPRSLVAGWLGNEFIARVREIGAPEPDIYEKLIAFEPYGSFWVAPPHLVYRSLQQWLVSAAQTVFVQRDAALAELMNWTLPDNPYAMSAMWWTRKTDEERVSYLQMLERVEKSRNPAFSLDQQMTIIRSIVEVFVARKTSGE